MKANVRVSMISRRILLKVLNRLYMASKGLGKGTIIIQRDFDALAAELQQAHTQITKLWRKQIGSNHKISLARYRIAELAEVINDMETRHQEDIEKLMNSIIELQNRMELIFQFLDRKQQQLPHTKQSVTIIIDKESKAEVVRAYAITSSGNGRNFRSRSQPPISNSTPSDSGLPCCGEKGH
ncbi:hypothetical protein Tco_0267342 [Tanacetum coccineum]